MQLAKIITLANAKVRLAFTAMERSLRATGCLAPLRVIPYDERRFELPADAEWWELPEVIHWLRAEKAHPMMRKYQCLLAAGYQYVDTDVVFLRNPEEVLAPHAGFITSCCHWRDQGHTTTEESRRIFAAKSTTWQKTTFNAGQFACDRALYTFEELKRTALRPEYVETCLRLRWHDQPGLNLLVHHSNVPITNLTLPPYSMESTWAGDYLNGYEPYWRDAQRKPYLMHWAGMPKDAPRAIDRLFLEFLTAAEKAEWAAQAEEWRRAQQAKKTSLRGITRRVKRAWQALVEP